jgi:hypothetical protein
MTGDVLREIAPVRSNVGERRTGAALLGLQAPRKIGRLEQPVLQVGAVDEVRAADLAGRDHLASLLHQGIPTVIEGHGVDHAGLLRRAPQLVRLGGRHGQRLFRHHVLAAGDRRANHAAVQVIRRGVVNDVDLRIRDELVDGAVDPGHAQLRCPLARAHGVAADNRDHVDKPKAAHGIDVVGSHEAGPNEPHSDPTHQVLLMGHRGERESRNSISVAVHRNVNGCRG